MGHDERRLRVSVDTERCGSSGQCAAALPEVFDQDDGDGRVVVLVEHPSSGLETAVRQAADRCPVGAIAVERTGEERGT